MSTAKGGTAVPGSACVVAALSTSQAMGEGRKKSLLTITSTGVHITHIP
jgi:hypothetical protein